MDGSALDCIPPTRWNAFCRKDIHKYIYNKDASTVQVIWKMKCFVPAPSIGQTASETRCSQSMDTETQSPPWCSQPLKVSETICCPPLSAPDSRPATCNSYSQRQGDSSTSAVRSVLSRSHTKSLHPKGQEQGRQGCCHQWHSNSSASSSHLCKTVQNSVRSSGRALLDPFPQKLPGCHGVLVCIAENPWIPSSWIVVIG